MKLNAIKGCLFGCAIGDAIGKSVETMSFKDIREKYGYEGITELPVNEEGIAEISDDIQMTLFTAEGALRAETRMNERGVAHYPTIIHESYRRWLSTQGKKDIQDFSDTGWLMKEKKYLSQKQIDNNIFSILTASKIGNTQNPLNKNKRCNGIIKVSPIGLIFDDHIAFEAATEVGAITHGHPTGYLASGYLAYLISLLVKRVDIEEAIYKATLKLRESRQAKELLDKIYLAMTLAEGNLDSPKAIKKIGAGSDADEALAIAIYSIFKHKKNYTDFFKKAVLCSVNHDGDSNTTGNITGAIVGTFLGSKFIPRDWIEKVEMKSVLEQMSYDLFQRYENSSEWIEKYPSI